MKPTKISLRIASSIIALGTVDMIFRMIGLTFGGECDKKVFWYAFNFYLKSQILRTFFEDFFMANEQFYKCEIYSYFVFVKLFICLYSYRGNLRVMSLVQFIHILIKMCLGLVRINLF